MLLIYRKNKLEEKPNADEPKKPNADEPKKPNADEPKKPNADEPKKPNAEEPKKPNAEEPKKPNAEEPKQVPTPSQESNANVTDADEKLLHAGSFKLKKEEETQTHSGGCSC
jgi:hypothetical protein